MFVKVKRTIGFVLLGIVLFSMIYIGIVRVNNKAPLIFGHRLIRVSTDSMEPELSVGEIVIAKKVEPETLKLGDVITYSCVKGPNKGTDVTHQISKEPYESDGVYYFTTRGIKPEAVDDPEINETQIRGKVVYRIPFVGTVYDFFTEWYGMVAFAILMVIIFGSDIMSLVQKFKKEPEDKEDSYQNPNDIRQRENIEVLREKEFEGIITNLDDPDL